MKTIKTAQTIIAVVTETVVVETLEDASGHGMLHFAVYDSGEGIADDKLDAVFEAVHCRKGMGRSGIFSPRIFSLKGFFGIKPSSDSTPTIIRYFPQSEFTRNVRCQQHRVCVNDCRSLGFERRCIAYSCFCLRGYPGCVSSRQFGISLKCNWF